MRVTCLANTGRALPAVCLDSHRGLSIEKNFPLTVGLTYVVYAITMYRGFAWYYVLDDHQLPYRVWEPAPLFEVESGDIPQGWIVGYERPQNDELGFPVVSFPEWVMDGYFYERLVDGDEDAVAVFEHRRVAAEAT
jgi:hypothetical protein